jgi:hypothetical protein
MAWLALSIFASTVLLIVDRNKKWKAFRTVCIVVAVIIAGGIGYLRWSDEQGAKRATLTKAVADYVAIYGSCPGGEQPDYHLNNPCPNSVFADKATQAKLDDCKKHGDVFDQLACENAINAAAASPASANPSKPASGH